MADVTVTIDGMHCTGCETRVQNGLSKVEGVRSVEADHDDGKATVAFVAGKEDEALLQETVEELGFEVEAIEAA